MGDVMVGSLRGLGYSVMPMLVSLIGACGLRLIWIATVFQIPEFHTIQTVYWSYPVSWSITFLAHLACFFWAMGRLKRQHAQRSGRRPLIAKSTLCAKGAQRALFSSLCFTCPAGL